MDALCELTNAMDIIRALGGYPEVMRLTGRDYSAVHNWGAFGKFPSNTYAVMTEALKAKGLSAPKSLWKMIESPNTQSEG